VDLAGGWARYAESGWLLVANLAVATCAFVALIPIGPVSQRKP
jgi:hypothetical protein